MQVYTRNVTSVASLCEEIHFNENCHHSIQQNKTQLWMHDSDNDNNDAKVTLATSNKLKISQVV